MRNIHPLRFMKTILATTDYSPAATNALEYAAALAGFLRARLVLFNAFHLAIPTATTKTGIPDIGELMEQNQLKLDATAALFARAYDIEVISSTSSEPFLAALDKQVKQHEADVVVMGMQGDSLSRKLFGSMTTSVIYRARYPVLVVPERAPYRGIFRILFACNYAYITPTHKLDMLHELAMAYDARVRILHVENREEVAQSILKPTQRAIPNMEQLLRGVKHTYAFIKEEVVARGIEKGIVEWDADLLVMVPHKPDFWDGLLRRSHTRQMALDSPIPLLALPNLQKGQQYPGAITKQEALH
jgi:nucleotide-binding universal stress UspA family protein